MIACNSSNLNFLAFASCSIACRCTYFFKKCICFFSECYSVRIKCLKYKRPVSFFYLNRCIHNHARKTKFWNGQIACNISFFEWTFATNKIISFLAATTKKRHTALMSLHEKNHPPNMNERKMKQHTFYFHWPTVVILD